VRHSLALLILFLALLSVPKGWSQGVVGFSNHAFILDGSGEGGVKSPPYAAALIIDEDGSFRYVPESVTTFRPGSLAGFVSPRFVIIPGHDVETDVTLEMIVFYGSTDADGLAAFQSNAFARSNPVTVTLGSGTIQPPDLSGVLPFVAPEPSVWALMLAGLGLIGWTSRKRHGANNPG
jgi:hypothetical protein